MNIPGIPGIGGNQGLQLPNPLQMLQKGPLGPLEEIHKLLQQLLGPLLQGLQGQQGQQGGPQGAGGAQPSGGGGGMDPSTMDPEALARLMERLREAAQGGPQNIEAMLDALSQGNPQLRQQLKNFFGQLLGASGGGVPAAASVRGGR